MNCCYGWVDAKVDATTIDQMDTRVRERERGRRIKFNWPWKYQEISLATAFGAFISLPNHIQMSPIHLSPYHFLHLHSTVSSSICLTSDNVVLSP